MVLGIFAYYCVFYTVNRYEKISNRIQPPLMYSYPAMSPPPIIKTEVRAWHFNPLIQLCITDMCKTLINSVDNIVIKFETGGAFHYLITFLIFSITVVENDNEYVFLQKSMSSIPQEIRS